MLYTYKCYTVKIILLLIMKKMYIFMKSNIFTPLPPPTISMISAFSLPFPKNE